jgi:hypothetical protein
MTKRGWLLVAFAMIAATSRGEDRRTLELVWLDHHGLFPNFEGVRSEADAIFRDLGLAVRWEVGTDPRPSNAGRLRIQVVLMPSEPSTWGLSPAAMGVVLLPDRSQQDSVFLFYRPILRNLGLGTKGDSMLRPSERRDVARALGRVVVHEVIHAVAPNLSHSDEGLMHDALLAGALSKRKIEVDVRTRNAFLFGLETARTAPALARSGSPE